MSEKSESPSSSPKAQESPTSSPKAQLHNHPDVFSDVILWRRKQLNVTILAAATAAWTAMEVYGYNFITLLSWVAMSLLLCLFFWGTIHRLLKKEAPDLSELEISEETAMETANSLRQRAEEGIRLMFHVSAEREWFVFAGVVACLYAVSELARRLDFLTLWYIGVVGGMTIPVIFLKKKERIRDMGEKMRVKSGSMYAGFEEKLQKIKNKIGGMKKEKKME
ncbi:hypothetical protein Salat_2449200 [Sesamum alatum]|uniref:Reticulon-like protein n=1 Tax=Sesamum alatum TaxID=300844 RepID=A0AAE2CBP7_9LAMI|nr:hypothetical protein Salat_2449200 [Sesamum alatum]